MAESATTEHRPLPRNAIAFATIVVGIALIAFAGLRFGVGLSILALAAVTMIIVLWMLFRAVQQLAEPPDETSVEVAAPTTAESGRRTALRALRDLSYERTIGNINDEDFALLEAQYRAQAKQFMRLVDTERKTIRGQAEAYAQRGVDAAFARNVKSKAREATSEPPTDSTHMCSECKTTNDPDAAFCKKCGNSISSAGAVSTKPESRS